MYEITDFKPTHDDASPVTNGEVARTLFQVGSLLELMECNPYRVRAYRRAALAVLFLPQQLMDYVVAGEEPPLVGVGAGLQGKIHDLVNGGHMGVHEALLEEIGEPLATLLSVQGIGPKTAIRLVSELHVETLADVAEAAREHRIQRLRGFGVKREERIARAIDSIIEAA
jgi:DNA polymerase (family 10)